jgi:hypothetical protein
MLKALSQNNFCAGVSEVKKLHTKDATVDKKKNLMLFHCHCVSA